VPDNERVGRLEVRMEKVEEGVSNFRDFQLEARDFQGWFRREQEHRKETDKLRSRWHFWLLGILSGLIVAGFGVMLGWALNFEKRHKVSSDDAPFAISSQQHPQDAGNPAAYSAVNK
jgi:hypothetical protein